MANKNLNKAKEAKKDEFYTQLEDINNELRHYREHFRDKTVLCNCDDPRVSNFFTYFAYNFEFLGLKKLITTCYKNQDIDLFSQNKSEQAVYLVYEGDKNGDHIPNAEEIGVKPEYVAQLMEYDKKFLIIGNQNAIKYKEIFPLLKENKVWLGYQFGDMKFKVPESYEPRETRFWIDETGQKWRSMGNICWFTNLDIKKRHEDIILYKHYTPEEYPTYANYNAIDISYNAIDISKTADIPCNYNGLMGVPITFMDKYNPEQFEIIGIAEGDSGKELGLTPFDRELKKLNKSLRDGQLFLMIDGYPKKIFTRIIIRKIKK